MTTNQTIDGVPREKIERALDAIEQVGLQDKFIDYTFVRTVKHELRALLDAPADARPETVPKHKFDTLVQHCKRLDGEIAQARAHVNEITLYQQNAVWFWQHDGEDFLESLSCPIIIQPHHLRELLKGVVPAAQPQGEPVGYDPSQRWAAIKADNKAKMEADGHGLSCFSVALYAEQPAPVAVVLAEAREWLGDGKNSDGLSREHWTPEYAALIDRIDATLRK